jgi:teichuronic acid biosynthesis glycosyltransferase TuaG
VDLVSIITPYYKKKKYIESAINSVLQQTYKNFELIIIYDDENKEDLNFLKKIIKKDKRIKIYINKKNLGAGRSRNKGIKLSKGSTIAFLDADDLWFHNKLQKQIFFMKKMQ